MKKVFWGSTNPTLPNFVEAMTNLNNGVTNSNKDMERMKEEHFAYLAMQMEAVLWSQGTYLYNRILQNPTWIDKIISFTGWQSCSSNKKDSFPILELTSISPDFPKKNPYLSKLSPDCEILEEWAGVFKNFDLSDLPNFRQFTLEQLENFLKPFMEDLDAFLNIGNILQQNSKTFAKNVFEQIHMAPDLDSLVQRLKKDINDAKDAANQKSRILSDSDSDTCWKKVLVAIEDFGLLILTSISGYGYWTMETLWVKYESSPTPQRARLIWDLIRNWHDVVTRPGFRIWSYDFVKATISLLTNFYKIVPPFKYAESIANKSKKEPARQLVSDIASFTSSIISLAFLFCSRGEGWWESWWGFLAWVNGGAAWLKFVADIGIAMAACKNND